MRYCSYYDGKITNKYNSFQIFFYLKSATIIQYTIKGRFMNR